MDITPTKNICPDCDDESLIINIPEELEPDLETTCWIYRVPINLRQVNEAAYTPQLVSIGPFHHGKPKFKSMERHKDKYRKQFWERGFCKHIDEKNVVEAFMKHEGRIERILRCYTANFELANEDPVKSWANVILTDACFIFELMLRKYESQLKREFLQTNDYILRTPWVRKRIELDLMLLENQLPFFVFTELFDFILDSQPDEIILHDTIPHYLSKRQNESERSFSLVILVTEFFYKYYLIGKPVDVKSSSSTPEIDHTATGPKQSTLAGKTRVDPAQIPDLISDLREPLTTMKRDKVPNSGGRGGGPISESDHVSKEKLVPQFRRINESPLSNAALFTPSSSTAGGRRGGPSSESDHVRKEKSGVDGMSVDPLFNAIQFTPPSGRGVVPILESGLDAELTKSEESFSVPIPASRLDAYSTNLGACAIDLQTECDVHFNLIVSPSSESDHVRTAETTGYKTEMSADSVSNAIHFTPSSVLNADSVSNAIHFTPSSGRGVGPISDTDLQDTKRQDLERFMKSKHFTDLFRKFFCEENYKKTGKVNNCLYNAKKLDRAGIKFESCTNAHLANIVSEKRCMSLKVKVREFTVQDDTECLMRNVMALEQCLYPLEPYICNYIVLLDQLIDTAEDVELLIEKKIARNLLGSNEAVATLVNSLGDQIVVQTSCYHGLCKELNDNYDNCWSISKETLKRVYFKDLWTGSSTVVGLFVTLFSVVSVISTIKNLISG